MPATRITNLGNSGRPLLMAETGKVGDDIEQRHLSHPSINGDGWLHGQNSDGLGRSWCRCRQHVRGARGRGRGWLHGQNSNGLGRSWCRRRHHVRWAQGGGRASSLPWHGGRLDGGVSLGARPMATRAAWAPRLRASCAEASQPTWHGATLAAEAGTVLRAFLGARPAEPCLHLRRGKGEAGSGHTPANRRGALRHWLQKPAPS